MTIPLGAKANTEPEEGEVGYSTTAPDPRCRDMCTSPNRPAYESPAKFGKERGTGRRLVYCPCCNHELLPEDDLRAKGTQVITNIRPPNLNPALEATAKRFVDVICRYDVVVLKDVKELR